MNHQFPIHPSFDLTGKVFGKLTVVKQYNPAEHGPEALAIVARAEKYGPTGGLPTIRWVVRCECGGGSNMFPPGGALVTRKLKSCGCDRPAKPTPMRKNDTKLRRMAAQARANTDAPRLQQRAKLAESFLKAEVDKGWRGA